MRGVPCPCLLSWNEEIKDPSINIIYALNLESRRRNNPGCFDEIGVVVVREVEEVAKNHVVACALSWITCSKH